MFRGVKVLLGAEPLLDRLHVCVMTLGILCVVFTADLLQKFLLEGPERVFAEAAAFPQPGILCEPLVQKLLRKAARKRL